MEQHWSYKVSSERWKGTELWGFGLTGVRMGGSKAENSALRYCCREHSSGLWWAGPASVLLERWGAGAGCLGQQGPACSAAVQGGADTSLHGRQTDTALRHRSSLSSCPPSIPAWLAWHTCSRNAPVSGQCGQEREEAPVVHSEQGWWVPLCSAVVSVNPLGSKGSKHFYALFAPPVAHRIILKEPVQTCCAAIPQEPRPSVQLKSEQLTKDFWTPGWWIFKIYLLALFKDLNLFSFTQEQLHQVQKLHTKQTELCKSGILGKLCPLPGSDSQEPFSVTHSEHFTDSSGKCGGLVQGIYHSRVTVSSPKACLPDCFNIMKTRQMTHFGCSLTFCLWNLKIFSMLGRLIRKWECTIWIISRDILHDVQERTFVLF